MLSPSAVKRLLSLFGLLIVSLTQLASGEGSNQTLAIAPPTPVFATNYKVQGVLSLPYAELNEPFTAWFDKAATRSRTDYYGDLYKIYQFGPKSAPEASEHEFGALYKLVYVPASFNQEQDHAESFLKRVHNAFSIHNHRHQGESASTSGGNVKAATKRACFVVKGSVGSTIQPQTVLPNLADFTYDSTSRCPHASELEHRHTKCELWKLITNVGDKKNTYRMWIRRDEQTGDVIPVYYYMLGYDSLLGSHYDRYDVTYRNFEPNQANDQDFLFDSQSFKCGSMPGPGEQATDGERRSHIIAQNPIHEYVIDPQRHDHIDHEFEQFIAKHGKEYPDLVQHRKGWRNFLHNFRFIHGKNRELKHYKLGVNRFADNDLQELGYLRGRLHSSGYNGGLDYERHHKLRGANGMASAKLPDNWDWTLRGAVTPVKDQAVCGSCWSYGTSGTVEGAYFVKTGKLPRLSQQQMVDCSWKFGNNGCDGGEDFRAYQYIMEAGGLATEEDYGHYLGVDGKCHDQEVKKSVQISGFYNVTSKDVDALKHAVVTYGPVTVAIDASRPTFTFYSHGVYYDEKCNSASDGLDHQVLVTGYTTIDDKFVWIVKNSWSTNWGNNGYILMSAEKNNCGLMDSPTVPIIKV